MALTVLAGTGAAETTASIAVPACAGDQFVSSMRLADAVLQSLSDQPKLILARETLVESRADLTASSSPFLPAGSILLDAEKFVPNNGASPVQVVGNNVIGGPRSDSSYGSLNVTWNLFSSGKDLAGYRGAKTMVRSSAAALDSQLNDTLTDVLQAYADLRGAQVTVDYQGGTVAALRAIAARAEDRFKGGQGTAVAVGQARAAELEAERTFNQNCRDLYDKSQALAEAFGLELLPGHIIKVTDRLPIADRSMLTAPELEAIVESDPAVVAAREQIGATQEKLAQARAQFGPTIALTARRDYLGQSPDGFSEANRHIGPDSYRVGIGFTQPIFPFVAETASLDKGKAEVRKAQASYIQARLDAEKRMQGAFDSAREASASYAAAKISLGEAEQVLILTRSQYAAGRVGLDSVERAQMDLEKVQTDVEILDSKNLLAGWAMQRSLQPTKFADRLFSELRLSQAAEQWRAGRLSAAPTGTP